MAMLLQIYIHFQYVSHTVMLTLIIMTALFLRIKHSIIPHVLFRIHEELCICVSLKIDD